MSEENKALYRRFIDEIIKNKKVEVIDELMDANMIEHNPVPGQPPGLDGMEKAQFALRERSPPR